MKNFKKFFNRRGNSNLITTIFVILVLVVLLMFCLEIFGQTSKLDDLQQIAQLMAREISLRGELNDAVNRRLTELEDIYNLEVDMTVDGDFIGSGSKMRLESSFVVSIRYKYSYGIGGIIPWRKEGIYVRKASGIVEEYHK